MGYKRISEEVKKEMKEWRAKNNATTEATAEHFDVSISAVQRHTGKGSRKPGGPFGAKAKTASFVVDDDPRPSPFSTPDPASLGEKTKFYMPTPPQDIAEVRLLVKMISAKLDQIYGNR